MVSPLQHFDTVLYCSLPSPSNRAHAGHGRRECLFSTARCPLGEQSPLFHTVVDANSHVRDRALVHCTSDMVFHNAQGFHFHLVECDGCPTLSQRFRACSAKQKHEDFNIYDDLFFFCSSFLSPSFLSSLLPSPSFFSFFFPSSYILTLPSIIFPSSFPHTLPFSFTFLP